MEKNQRFRKRTTSPKGLYKTLRACRSDFGQKLYEKQQQSLKDKPGKTRRMVKIYPEGHIETIFDRQHYENTLKGLETNKQGILPENRDFIKRFVLDARLGKTNPKRSKKEVGEARILRYIRELQRLSLYYNKAFDKVEMQDMEKFILDLKEGRYKGIRGKPYENNSAITLKSIVKKFYKWLLGNNKVYPEIVEWISTNAETKEYITISQEQVETALTRMTSNNSANLLRNRALWIFLFDSGVRADELLNIRLKHLTLENGNYKVRIEFSKTRKRTLSLPFCKKHLDEWLDIHPARSEPLAQLFPLSYDQLRLLISRIGRQISIVGLTPHSLRHSSATYWARHLSQYQLCYRFGWSMNSQQPARYIDREGLDQEKTIEVVKTNNVEKLAQENTELNKRLALLEDQMDRLLAEDKQELARIIEAIKQKAKI